MSASTMKTTTVQLPKKLLKELQEIAKAEGRSLASQVRIFLADSVTRKNTNQQQEAAQ
jgi:metal-responsive CopG/Arc/MetJ family transcriptional regulator